MVRTLEPEARRLRGGVRAQDGRARALPGPAIDNPGLASYAAAVAAKAFDSQEMSAELVRIQSALQQMRKDQELILKKLAAQRLAGEKSRAERPATPAP